MDYEKVLKKARETNPKADFEIINYQKIIFYPHLPKDPFNKFLLKDRINPFFVLKLLDLFWDDDQFIVGKENTTYIEYGYPQGNNQKEIKRIKINEQICEHVFSIQEVWDFFVGNLAIDQIITDKYNFIEELTFFPVGKEKIPKIDSAEISEGLWKVEQGELTFFNLDKKVFFNRESLYIEKDHPLLNKIKSMIEQHYQEWEDYLVKHKSIIDHEVYIVWLQKNFPSRIKIRMIK